MSKTEERIAIGILVFALVIACIGGTTYVIHHQAVKNNVGYYSVNNWGETTFHWGKKTK